MTRKKIGRSKGRRTKGYFYRAGRGWYTKDRGRFVRLLFEDGAPITNAKVDERLVQEAYARLLLSKQAKPVWECEVTVLEFCR